MMVGVDTETGKRGGRRNLGQDIIHERGINKKLNKKEINQSQTNQKTFYFLISIHGAKRGCAG